MKLADGTTFEVWGDDNGKSFLKNVRVGDKMEICFGNKMLHAADEGPDARPGFAFNARNGETYSSVGYAGRTAQQFPPPSTARRTL